ncbi:hypothetical protein [Sphingopyxis sp.]|uniref:hypothetical protein n=1 Tax=Sphingopyxis sp. TaxID=1908224 RepID=UPI00344E6534|nr:hypothetical protein [Sphingopyxis sp.]
MANARVHLAACAVPVRGFPHLCPCWPSSSSGGGVGEGIAKAAAEQTRSNALKESFEKRSSCVDARLATKDLKPAERMLLGEGVRNASQKR